MIITTKQPKDWRDLQNKVGVILEQCGFNVEIEKTIKTSRGKVELDVYAEEIVRGRKNTLVCECKHWKSNIPQSVIHAFRSVVNDLGSNIGYIITTSDFQSGSISSTEYTNVELLTWKGFQSSLFESWFETYFIPQITKRLEPTIDYIKPILPRWIDEMNEVDKEAYFTLRDEYEVFGIIMMSFSTYTRIIKNHKMPTLPLSDSLIDVDGILQRIPDQILEEKGYSEFLEKCIQYGDIALLEFNSLRDKYSKQRNTH